MSVHLLASWPTWVLVLVWLGLCGAFAAVSRLALQRLVPDDQRAGVLPVAGPLMPALGAAFALLTALSLSGEAAQLRSAEDQVSAEASAASRLAWAATSPGLDPVAVHQELLGYLQFTRSNEWHGKDERGDPATLTALAALERTVRAQAATKGLGSAQASELLTSLDSLTSGRRQRLAAANHMLPGFYIAVVAISGLALIANSSALALAHRRRLALLPLGLVAVVALALALLFAISAPFLGGFVASGFPIDNVVNDLRNGVFHP